MEIMKFDVSDIINNNNGKKEINLTLDLNNINENGEEIKFNKPVKILGYAINKDELIIIKIKVDTELIIKCSRCLDEFIHPIDIEVYEEFFTKPDNDDDDKLVITNESIDISQVISNNILLSLPIKKLCKDDCKGLCQVCGTNLNTTTCDCEKKDIDPRLEKLKDLF